MASVPEELPDLIPPRPDTSAECGVALQTAVLRDGFSCQQLRTAGLEAVAEKTIGGRNLDLEDALALSRASLPLLGRIVQLRPGAGDGPSIAADTLPIEQVAALPKSRPCIGQALTDWEPFCRTLIALRNEVPSTGPATFWYPIVRQPLDQDHGCGDVFTAVEVLRAIAVARLVLPAEIEVRAPLATLGPKLAQVALEFGASHLGYVALDGQMPGDPLVADPKALDELAGSCVPTSLKDELTIPS
jgi:hypothetical protein